MANPEPDPAHETERRDAAFAAAEQARREAGWALTPAQRLELVEEALDLAWACGALRPREAPVGLATAPPRTRM